MFEERRRSKEVWRDTDAAERQHVRMLQSGGW